MHIYNQSVAAEAGRTSGHFKIVGVYINDGDIEKLCPSVHTLPRPVHIIIINYLNVVWFCIMLSCLTNAFCFTIKIIVDIRTKKSEIL